MAATSPGGFESALSARAVFAGVNKIVVAFHNGCGCSWVIAAVPSESPALICTFLPETAAPTWTCPPRGGANTIVRDTAEAPKTTAAASDGVNTSVEGETVDSTGAAFKISATTATDGSSAVLTETEGSDPAPIIGTSAAGAGTVPGEPCSAAGAGEGSGVTPGADGAPGTTGSTVGSVGTAGSGVGGVAAGGDFGAAAGSDGSGSGIFFRGLSLSGFSGLVLASFSPVSAAGGVAFSMAGGFALDSVEFLL